ncbi:MAG TPA: TonB-dependent receptor [Ferruginibacter sp.]|nr:TonB-dependent receptor [Ferruginibacter sp.]HMP20223.1 TonB-dependent receptor [Ferruginibacter sp.]
MLLKKFGLFPIVFFISTITLQAQFKNEVQFSVDTAEISTHNMPQIEIISYKNDRLFRVIPGSVAVITDKQIKTIAPLSGNDVIKKLPGVNVVDEEGAGLRINIGIRGLDPDRSRNVLMLEDGVPVALNPYGEPEMYFTPVIDKMKGIEILKGSGQILYGPQTIGGVANFITANPPENETVEMRLKGGQNGFFSGYASYGNTVGNTGFVVSYMRKQADNMGPTNFQINDVSAKLRIELSSRSRLGIKLGLYDEVSNSTYVGITQTMYDKGGQDFVQLAPNDLLPVRRYNASVTHQYKINDAVQLQTTAFAYTTTRDWRRQDFSTNPNAANQTGVIWGDPTVSGGALYMLRTNGHRNRQFEVSGIEPKLQVRHKLFQLQHNLQTGVRLLWEKANEQFIIGNKPDAVAGNMRDNEVRKGFAISAYALNEVNITDRLTANVGIRVEQFDYRRRILRGRFRVNNVNNVVVDTNVLAKSNTTAVIPGGGFTYNASQQVTLFAGAHKGFAPPRTKDAITAEGVAMDLDAESSTNIEAGARFAIGGYLTAEATFFMMDFQNQIIPVSQSSGNANATGLANGGRTRHKGIEAGFEADIAKAMGSTHQVIIGANATYVHSRFIADRFIPKDGTPQNVRNNKLPYAPSLVVNTTVGYQSPGGLGIRFYGNYIGEQFADELNTVLPDAAGLIGKIDSRFLIDGSVYYHLPGNKVTFTLSGKNITDQRFIASRRPQGIKVGLPRFVTFGVDMKL